MIGGPRCINYNAEDSSHARKSVHRHYAVVREDEEVCGACDDDD